VASASSFHKKALLEEPERQATKDPVLGIECLFKRITRMRDLVERYLYDNYGFEATRVGAESMKEYLESSERSPSNPKERADFLSARTHWWALEEAIIRMCDIVEAASSLDKDTFRAMYKACKWALTPWFGTLTLAFPLHESYEQKRLHGMLKEKAILVFLSGLVGMQISLKRSSRLENALKEEYGSASCGLLQELAAATLLECDTLVQQGEPPTNLTNRVATNLASMGQLPLSSKKLAKLATSDRPDLSSSDPLPQEFWVKEEVNALIASANLAEREQQILELRLEGRRYREIADELGITDGAAKTTMFRVREKMREALG
jgi:RNA polymerase sigma factor (sigma-70 family)